MNSRLNPPEKPRIRCPLNYYTIYRAPFDAAELVKIYPNIGCCCIFGILIYQSLQLARMDGLLANASVILYINMFNFKELYLSFKNYNNLNLSI